MLSKEQHEWTQTFIGVRFKPHTGEQAGSGSDHRRHRGGEEGGQGHGTPAASGAAAQGTDGLGPMLPDCKIVHGRVPGPRHHVLCTTHGHVVDDQKRIIIAGTLAEYIARNGPRQSAAPARGPAHSPTEPTHSGAGPAHPAAGSAAHAAPANPGPQMTGRAKRLCKAALEDVPRMSANGAPLMELLRKVSDDGVAEARTLIAATEFVLGRCQEVLGNQAMLDAVESGDQQIVPPVFEGFIYVITGFVQVNYYTPIHDAMLVKIHEAEQRRPGALDSKGLGDTLRGLDGAYRTLVHSCSQTKSALTAAMNELNRQTSP